MAIEYREHLFTDRLNTDAIVSFHMKVVPKPDNNFGTATYILLGDDGEDRTFIDHFEDTVSRPSNVWFEPMTMGVEVNSVRIAKNFLSDRFGHGTDEYACGPCYLAGQAWVSFRDRHGRRLGLSFDEVSKVVADTIRWRFPLDEMVLHSAAISRNASRIHPTP
jgi:hypothetical protein